MIIRTCPHCKEMFILTSTWSGKCPMFRHVVRQQEWEWDTAKHIAKCREALWLDMVGMQEMKRG